MELEVVHIDEGGRDNWLVRQGEVAGHVVVTAARLIVSFPAGNEVAGLWFHPEAPRQLWVEEAPTPWRGGELLGLRLVLRHQGALRPARVFLGNARVVRELDEGRSVAAREALMGPLDPEREERGGEVVYRRRHLDGRHRTELTLRTLGEGAVEVRAGTSWPPLTPIPRSRLLSERGRRLIDESSGPRRRSLERAQGGLRSLSPGVAAGDWRDSAEGRRPGRCRGSTPKSGGRCDGSRCPMGARWVISSTAVRPRSRCAGGSGFTPCSGAAVLAGLPPARPQDLPGLQPRAPRSGLRRRRRGHAPAGDADHPASKPVARRRSPTRLSSRLHRSHHGRPRCHGAPLFDKLDCREDVELRPSTTRCCSGRPPRRPSKRTWSRGSSTPTSGATGWSFLAVDHDGDAVTIPDGSSSTPSPAGIRSGWPPCTRWEGVE